MNTSAIFFPFDLFGSPGTSAGAALLADAFREMTEDNRREKRPTRARVYNRKIHIQEVTFENLDAYQDWRQHAGTILQEVLRQGDNLLWVAGNHLGTLPIYEALSEHSKDTLIIQLDAHLDIHHFSDCTSELSHGNFMLHLPSPLPRIVNVGHRDLLLLPSYIEQYYQATFSAAQLIRDEPAVLKQLRKLAQEARSVFIDIDCDVLDPAYFPALSHPLPFGLCPPMLLRVLNAIWSDRIKGLALSEFDPARDRDDQCLELLMWLIEFVLLRLYERREGES